MQQIVIRYGHEPVQTPSTRWPSVASHYQPHYAQFKSTPGYWHAWEVIHSTVPYTGTCGWKGATVCAKTGYHELIRRCISVQASGVAVCHVPHVLLYPPAPVLACLEPLAPCDSHCRWLTWHAVLCPLSWPVVQAVASERRNQSAHTKCQSLRSAACRCTSHAIKMGLTFYIMGSRCCGMHDTTQITDFWHHFERGACWKL